MSSILLTKSKIIFPFFMFLSYVSIAFWIAAKGCNENIQKPNLHGARQFFPIDVDTMKKPISKPVINHNLVLRGSDTLFNVLWTQIISPQDVTPRNLAILQKWVQLNTVQDTITIKK